MSFPLRKTALALALSLVGAPAWAQSQTPPDAPAPAGSGRAVRTAGTAPLEISRDAPDKHVVVRGDTLWGIAGKFLEKPWRWPEIWQLNREQIRNPHLIYPGDIVYLDNTGPTPRLRLAKSVDGAPAAAGTGAGASGRGGGAGRPRSATISMARSSCSRRPSSAM